MTVCDHPGVKYSPVLPINTPEAGFTDLLTSHRLCIWSTTCHTFHLPSPCWAPPLPEAPHPSACPSVISTPVGISGLEGAYTSGSEQRPCPTAGGHSRRPLTPRPPARSASRDPLLYNMFEVLISSLDDKFKRVDTIERAIHMVMRHMEIMDSRLQESNNMTANILTRSVRRAAQREAPHHTQLRDGTRQTIGEK